MANPEHLAILKQGVEAWNEWREEDPRKASEADLSGADLSKARLREADFFLVNLRDADLHGARLDGAVLTKADLTGAQLNRASLQEADLSHATLNGANLYGAYLMGAKLPLADLRRADLRGANLRWARLFEAKLTGARLGNASLREADLTGADLTGADLTGANLTMATLVGTNLSQATIDGCRIHGISAWRLQLQGAQQAGLVITSEDEPAIAVDDLEVAQFLYLLLNNEKIKGVLDTVTSKVVLILGRFSKERKPVLDALREELRRHDYVPVIFDFDKPVDKSIADTVTTLAKLARFVIADVTDPSWVTVETQLIIRESRSVPFRLIKHQSASVPSPINDLRADSPHLIKPFDYESLDHAVASVKTIVQPAEEMAEVIRAKRKAIEEDPW